jgi:hypothetical protein
MVVYAQFKLARRLHMPKISALASLALFLILYTTATLVPAAEYPPMDHGGADLILSRNDLIWGQHTNIGRFEIPAGATVFVRDFGAVSQSVNLEDTGFVEINAEDIVINGTLTALASGHWGGGGGGGGGGGAAIGFTASVRFGDGGDAGSGGNSASPGLPGTEGTSAFGPGNSANGGDGGSGGRGGGQAGGLGGSSGAGSVGDGGPGRSGQDGGYFVRGGNGDPTTDLEVIMGSGGGGGGGGAGGGAGDPGSAGKTAGGGGGGGAEGANGGGAIKLSAANSIRISGRIDTRGGGRISPETTDRTTADPSKLGPGSDGQDGVITLLSAIGGDGGVGGSSEVGASSASGGLGGRGFSTSDAIGTGWDGGRGGESGVGGGGGVLLFCPMSDQIDLTSGTIDARGGSGLTDNGGTVKIVFSGADPTSGPVTILAGRIFTRGVLKARHWREYE